MDETGGRERVSGRRMCSLSPLRDVPRGGGLEGGETEEEEEEGSIVRSEPKAMVILAMGNIPRPVEWALRLQDDEDDVSLRCWTGRPGRGGGRIANLPREA